MKISDQSMSAGVLRQNILEKANEAFSENKKPEEPLSICEAYEFQLTVLANSNVTWREKLFDQQSLQLRFPEDYPGKTMIHNQCHNNVRLIYADPDFWKIHHQELSTKQLEQQVADYLLKHYGMVFDFPSTIWRQMVINPIHRNFLCLLMTHCLLYTSDAADE